MRESIVEKKFAAKCRKLGMRCVKFHDTGRRGAPDRQVLYQGQVAFVECKAPGEAARAEQLRYMAQLIKDGFLCLVHDGQNDDATTIKQYFDLIRSSQRHFLSILEKKSEDGLVQRLITDETNAV